MTIAPIPSPGRVSGLLGSLLVMAACGSASTPAASPGGDPGTSAAVSPSGERVSMVIITLTDDGCSLDAPPASDVGALHAEMVNESDGQFDVHLWRLDDDHSHDDFDAHVVEEMRRIGAGEPSLGHPTFASLVAESSAAPGSDGVLDAEVARGTYSIACIARSPGGEPVAIWAVGPLEVR